MQIFELGAIACAYKDLLQCIGRNWKYAAADMSGQGGYGRDGALSRFRRSSAISGLLEVTQEKKKALGIRLRAFRLAGHANLVGGTGIEPVTPAV